MSTNYAIRIEFAGFGDISDEHAEALIDEIAEYHGTISGSPTGRVAIRLNVPGETIDQALKSALAISRAAVLEVSGHPLTVVAIEILTEADFDAREGWEYLPDLIDPQTAADLLHVTPQRVGQMIREGKFASAQKIGERAWVITRAEVEARAGQVRPQVGDTLAAMKSPHIESGA